MSASLLPVFGTSSLVGTPVHSVSTYAHRSFLTPNKDGTKSSRALCDFDGSSVEPTQRFVYFQGSLSFLFVSSVEPTQGFFSASKACITPLFRVTPTLLATQLYRSDDEDSPPKARCQEGGHVALSSSGRIKFCGCSPVPRPPSRLTSVPLEAYWETVSAPNQSQSVESKAQKGPSSFGLGCGAEL